MKTGLNAIPMHPAVVLALLSLRSNVKFEIYYNCCCTVAVRPYIILVLLWSSDVTGVAAPLAIWHNEQWGGRSLIDPFQIVSALQDSLTFCKGQTFINPMVLIQSTPLCPPLFAEDFCQIQQNFWDFFTRQDPVLSLPEGYYLACRCSVPWTSLKRCWKRSY